MRGGCHFFAVLFFVLFSLTGQSRDACAEAPPRLIRWQGWQNDLFAQAAAQKKLLILDLAARWCHWCHVMEGTTYADPQVAKIIAAGFIAIRVDQDSRPDLANRYRDYGWPATIIFDGTGRELLKRAGYIEPAEMVALLKNVLADPNPEPSAAAAPLVRDGAGSGGAVAAATRAALREKHYAAADSAQGGLRTKHKFLESDFVEYSLREAGRGSMLDGELVRRTLAYNRKLLDPVWGGVYQYSTHGDWDHPHFEKIAWSQAVAMRLYADAYALWGEKSHLEAASSVAGYVGEFLTAPDGGLYASQDADVVRGERASSYFALSDALRRQQGIPAVDTNVYARENGWLIRALCHLADSSGERRHLDAAERAAQRIIASRASGEGCFRHGEADAAGPYLGDTLAMGQAFLALYAANARREWLERARDAGRCIGRRFVVPGEAGVLTAVPEAGAVLPPVRILSEQIEAARFFNLLRGYTGDEAFAAAAETALRYAGQPEIALAAIVESGVLLAADELESPPLHLTVVGAKTDAQAQALFDAARKFFSGYKRLEWWDPAEGRLPNHDVEYPVLPKPALFVCTEKRCSLPLADPAKLPDLIKQMRGDFTTGGGKASSGLQAP